MDTCLHLWKLQLEGSWVGAYCISKRCFLWFSRTDSMTGFINLRLALHFFFPAAVREATRAQNMGEPVSKAVRIGQNRKQLLMPLETPLR